jgi:hypothetical protein
MQLLAELRTTYGYAIRRRVGQLRHVSVLPIVPPEDSATASTARVLDVTVTKQATGRVGVVQG